MLPHIKNLLAEFTSDMLTDLWGELDPLEDVRELIDRAIIDDPPITLRDGGIIKDGFHEEADKLRSAKTEGKNWLAELELREKEKTGIKNLKVKFNKVFGYY
ncbi:DNA mismatch repair protein MutS, partial [Clostridioides difficile]|nr:DNA mismatch repair protein MutS [Clostridioides difficile]